MIAEISSGESAAAAKADMEAILAEARDAGVIADYCRRLVEADEAAGIWRMRYSISDVQRPEGVSIKHDISVPVSAMPALHRGGDRGGDDAGARLPAGAVRPSSATAISTSMSASPRALPGGPFRAMQGEINRVVFELVASHGGSIAAEHGVGQMKRDLLPTVRSADGDEMLCGV